MRNLYLYFIGFPALKYYHFIKELLDEASSVPFAISPPTMASVMKNLYALNEGMNFIYI